MEAVRAGVGIFTFLIVLAIVSVILSSKSQSSSVINAITTGFANDLKAATSTTS